MITNEKVLQAVNRLTDTYNALRLELKDIKQSNMYPCPLYKNHVIYDMLKDYKLTDPELQNVISVGSGSILKREKLNGQWFVEIKDKSIFTNITQTTKPVAYCVIKIKLTHVDGTFFIKKFFTDNWAYGISSVWICDPITLQLKTFLGTQCEDKHSGNGINYMFSPYNTMAMDKRYYQWLGYNYNVKDLLFDDDGYVYFGIVSNVHYTYIGGWGYAERNTDFFWTPGRITNLDFYGNNGKSILNGSYEDISQHKFDINKIIKDFRIPYTSSGKDLIVGILQCFYIYIPKIDVCGNKTQIKYRYDYVPTGNFQKLNSIGLNKYKWTTIHIPSNEVAANTIELDGLKVLSLDFKIYESEANFYFNGFYTESENSFI